jgi:hypothetical protein
LHYSLPARRNQRKDKVAYRKIFLCSVIPSLQRGAGAARRDWLLL